MSTPIENKLSDLQLRVYGFFQHAGWEGHTTDEIEAATGKSHQSISARVNELANWKDENGNPAPLIERRGITRTTRAGRPAGVYVLAGLTAADEREKDAK